MAAAGENNRHGDVVSATHGAVLKARLSISNAHNIRTAAVSADRRFLALSSGTKTRIVQIDGLDVEGDEPVSFHTVKTKKALPAAWQVLFAPDVFFLWIIDLENAIRAVELPTMRLLPRVGLEIPTTVPFRLHPYGLCLSPDGEQLAYSIQSTLYIYALRPSGWA